MTYTIEYSKEADRTLRKWKKSNPHLFKKATKILMDIMAHPRTGLGHPEALIGGNDVTRCGALRYNCGTFRFPCGVGACFCYVNT